MAFIKGYFDSNVSLSVGGIPCLKSHIVAGCWMSSSNGQWHNENVAGNP